MRKRLAVIVPTLVMVCFGVAVVRTSTTAAKVPNHGFPVYKSACAMRNALSVNTPVAKSHARMACLPGVDGTLSWQREPATSVSCISDGQVWGRLTCVSGKWSIAAATFNGTMTDAVTELARVVAVTNMWSFASPPAPSGSKFVMDQYLRSPVENELRDRLATDGYVLSRNRYVYVLEKGQDKRCLKWVDPWPAGWSGERELRTDALVSAICPTADIRPVYAQIEAIALEAGTLYHSNQAAFLARKSEFTTRIEDTGFTGQFFFNHTRSEDPNYVTPNFPDLTFYVSDDFQCMRYVHNGGAPYITFDHVSRLCE